MSAAAGATAKALEIVLRQPQLRQRLEQNARRLRGGLRALGLAVDDWPTPIIGLSIGSGENMRRIHDELRLAGIIVPYFAAYSGAGPAGRLRIAVFATHTEEMLDRLLARVAKGAVERGAGSREQGAGSGEQGAGSGERGAGSGERRAEEY